MSRISTGTGDDGTTGLVGGSRVPKTHPRVVAVGAVDEANDALGVARALAKPELAEPLARFQHDLFRCGADLASAPGVAGALRMTRDDVGRVEALTNVLEKELPPLQHFILPGGTPAASALFVARGVVRRAEREAWRAREAGEAIGEPVLTYLNRLSDCLFLLARRENVRAGIEAEQWPGKARQP